MQRQGLRLAFVHTHEAMVGLTLYVMRVVEASFVHKKHRALIA